MVDGVNNTAGRREPTDNRLDKRPDAFFVQ